MESMRSLPLLLALVACGPQWTTITQSGPPSALRGATRVTVAFDYTDLLVGEVPVQSYLAGLEPPKRAEMEQVLQVMADGFLAELIVGLPISVVPAEAPAAEGEVRVTARFRAMELGSYRVDRRIDSQLVTDIVWTIGQTPTDAIRTRTRVQANVSQPTTLGRMQLAAGEAAEIAAAFFELEQSR